MVLCIYALGSSRDTNEASMKHLKTHILLHCSWFALDFLSIVKISVSLWFSVLLSVQGAFHLTDRMGTRVSVAMTR